jgi:hypothetical protein
LAWLIIRPVFVEGAKRALRACGTPAIAIIRWKHDAVMNWSLTHEH